MELANGKVNKFFSLPDENENKYYINQFDADSNKYNNNVYILSSNVPEGSTVLDIGCGPGNFGKKLFEKGCTLYGIERDIDAAQYALESGYYKDIFKFDMESTQDEEYKRLCQTLQDVDVLIISDVLEHLEYPTDILRHYSKFVKENGIILVSVPNVAHIDIALNLLNGNFNYTDMGILDNTHLKFFTRLSFAQWISQMNEVYEDFHFDVQYLGGMFYNNEFVQQVKTEYKELFEILEHVQDYNALQLLFKLTKIDKNNETTHLNSILQEKKVDVVKLLAHALKNIFEKDVEAPKLVLSERMLYESEIKKKDEHIQYIEKGIEWHRNQEEEQQKYIEELQKGIEWHQNQQENQHKYIEQLQKEVAIRVERIEELEKGLEWYRKLEEDQKAYNQAMIEKQNQLEEANSQLRRKIFEIENSLSWKLTRFLRKK